MRCEECDADGPTRHATFSRAMGFVVVSSVTTRSNELCTSCLTTRYRSYMGVTALLGWWSIPTFPRAILYLASNAKEYRRAMAAAPLSAEPTKTELRDAAAEEWRVAREQSASRLFIVGAVLFLVGVGVIVMGIVMPPEPGKKPIGMGIVLGCSSLPLLAGAVTMWVASMKRRSALHGPAPKSVGSARPKTGRGVRRR